MKSAQQFKIRASMLSHIMTDPKTKSEPLSETCKTYLEDWIKEEVYGRRKLLKTDAIQKGIECETEAIFVLNKARGTNFQKSPSVKMENDWCTGSEDIDDKENFTTYDTKVCETFDTFPIIKEKVDKAYWRQGQAYMWLKGENYKKHYIVKTLVNSPKWIIEQKLYYAYNNLCKKYEDNMEYVDAEYEAEARAIFLQHVFDKQVTINSNGVVLQLTDDEVIPYEKRVSIILVERDDDAIEKIKQRVQECRDYLEILWY